MSVGAYLTGSRKSLKKMSFLIFLAALMGAPLMNLAFHGPLHGFGKAPVAGFCRFQNFAVSLMSVLLPCPRQSNWNTLYPASDSLLASPFQSPLPMLLSLPGG